MPPPRGPLPSKLLVGYANWGECDGKIEQAVASGVNVLIWFALSLNITDGTHPQPKVAGGPNLTCVAQVARALEAQHLPTHHFISIGGWGALHPSPKVSAADWWSALTAYDTEAARAGLVGGFDGIDWDLEGTNTKASPRNTFGPDLLRLVANVSIRAKAAGKLVSLAPPQSYLDVTTASFSSSVVERARCWPPTAVGSNFSYAGRNTYAPLLALAPPGTYDFVSLQLYETYSIASCHLSRGTPLSTYLADLVRSMDHGWRVAFSAEPALGLASQNVSVPHTRLVLGLANGWTAPGRRALYLAPSTLATSWHAAPPAARPRGFMFWDIADEGRPPRPGLDPPLYLAKELNRFLETRRPARAVEDMREPVDERPVSVGTHARTGDRGAWQTHDSHEPSPVAVGASSALRER